MLTVRGLSVRYARAAVLSDVSIDIAVGEAWVIAGRNGAGKSTLLKSLIGLVPPASGSIRFQGQEIAGLPPFRIARLGLGYVPEERRIFADLSVEENLRVARRPGPLERGARDVAVSGSERPATSPRRHTERR